MTPEEFNKKSEELKEQLQQIIVGAPIVQSQDLLGRQLQRIFVNGKDSFGGDIGRYKPGRYVAKRNAAGRRIDKVDLQFTGALFESFKNGVVEDGAVIGFNNEKEAKIASYNEERFGKKIFPPSEEEQTDAKQLMVDYVKEKLQEAVKNIYG